MEILTFLTLHPRAITKTWFNSFQQEAVAWAPDEAAPHCMNCGLKFGLESTMILSGRHHCRLCGACICRDCCQALFYHGLAEIINFSKKVIFSCLIFFYFKGRGNDWIALFSSSNLTYDPLMYCNQTYMVYRAFAELLESRKKIRKKFPRSKVIQKIPRKS